jgi:peptide deformylase
MLITIENTEKFQLLRARSQECLEPFSQYKEEIKLMADTLDSLKEEALGLAAVQVGVPLRMFMLRRGDINWLYINPTVVSCSNTKSTRPESCLSIPNFVVNVPRPKQTTIKYFDLEGREHQETFTGLFSRVFWHENDHLNGILLDVHLKKLVDKHEKKQKIKRMEKAKRTKKRRKHG